MVKQFTFRPSPELAVMIDTVASKRKRSRADIMRIALDIGLKTLLDGRHVNPIRTATLLEFIAAHADLMGKKLYPDQAEVVPTVVSQRMEQYHGKV